MDRGRTEARQGVGEHHIPVSPTTITATVVPTTNTTTVVPTIVTTTAVPTIVTTTAVPTIVTTTAVPTTITTTAVPTIVTTTVVPTTITTTAVPTTITTTATTTIAATTAHTPQRPVSSPYINLERTSSLKRTSGFIVAYLMMETWKQMSNYGLSASHGGVYPLPSTLLVFATEFTKLFIVLVWAARSQAQVWAWRPCLKLTIPASCYFVTNLLYLLALPSTPPPLWMVLIQTRTLYTALAYLVVFGREVGAWQMVGCLLVVVSLPLARTSELQAGRSSLTTFALLASQVAALFSSIASLMIEVLLKNDPRSLVEQQVWLYLWGSLLAFFSLALHTDLSALAHLHLQVWSAAYVVAAVMSSALAGLCVPIIVRNLDSIAKDYLAALNNTLLSVVTAVLFPLSFTLSPLYLASLTLLLSGIWLYERKSASCCPLPRPLFLRSAVTKRDEVLPLL